MSKKIDIEINLSSLTVDVINKGFEKFNEIIEEVNAAFPIGNIKRNAERFELNLNYFLFIGPKLPYQEIINYDLLSKKLLERQVKNNEFITNPSQKINHSGKEWVKKNSEKVEEIRKQLINNGFKRDLLDHQLKDFFQMKLAPHAANFSVPGSGKTSVILALYSFRKNKGPLLVFVPNRGVATSWMDEIKECFEKNSIPKVLELKGPYDNLSNELNELGPNCIGLITYRQTIANRCFEVLLNYVSKTFDIYAVLDESHRIKSAVRSGFQKPGIIGQNLLTLSKFFERKDILSGTPMTLDINDFISQIEFLYPNSGYKKKLTDNENSPRSVVDNLFTRTYKFELDLPETKNHLPIPAEMSKAQSAFYAITVNKFREIYDRLPEKNLFNDLRRAIVRIIELSVDPYNVATKLKKNPSGDKLSQYISENILIKNALEKLLEEGPVSEKMRVAMNKAIDISSKGEKVIIWSYFVNSLDVMEKEFIEKYSIEPLVLKGGSDDEYIIETFNAKNDHQILLANPEKGSEGISLHKNCNNAIYLSRTYKAGQYLQSRDRIHRVGMDLDKLVNYYFVESVYGESNSIQTIDRRISNNLEGKIKKLAEAMNDEELIVVSDFEEMGEEISSDFDENDVHDFIQWLIEQPEMT